ncbi:MAG TPA: hypothetical protein ENO21_03855 [Firmicutes bacterium]|nr:hypothetical protein [Bacillota bacterium]
MLFSSDGITAVNHHLAASHEEWPRITSLEPDTENMLSYHEKVGLIVFITQSTFPEFGGKPGEMIGLNIGVRHSGEPWYCMLGEPNTLIQFELR